MTRFLLLVNYDNGVVSDGMPMLDWDPADVRAHLAYYEALNAELTERGELVGGEALAWPEATKIVRSDGKSAPVVTDGPYAETQEVLAGYWIVECDSFDRATEIAAKLTQIPGPDHVRESVRGREVIDVRPIADSRAELDG